MGAFAAILAFAATMDFGLQKSGAMEATCSGALLSSGKKRLITVSVPETASAFALIGDEGYAKFLGRMVQMTLKACLRDHQVYATRRDSPQRRLLHALQIGRKGAGRFADAFPLAEAETGRLEGKEASEIPRKLRPPLTQGAGSKESAIC
jgi:hypothetical protein